MKIGFLLTLAFAAFVTSDKITYDGYKLIRITPQTPFQLNALSDLQAEGVSFDMKIPKVGASSSILISPDEFDSVMRLLSKYEITLEETVHDVGKFIRSQKVSSKTHDGRLYWDEYYTFEAINEYLEEQVSTHSAIASLENIGQTYEERDLTVIKISNTPVGGPAKPVIFFEANIHAREWITGAVATHVIDQLLNGPDTELQAFLDDFDFYVLPIANPDGYVYTHQADRFWRKTRSNTTSPLGCKGVDPNRNFDAFWAESGGASDDPCSLTYRGDRVFSEPEVEAMANFMSEVDAQATIVLYLSLHSAGQYLLIPAGMEHANPITEYDEYMRIGNLTAEAHTAVHDKVYIAGSITDLMYNVTGSSLDWAHQQLRNAKFHVTYELRDKGQFGHLLPPNQILPSCEEFLAGFKVILEEMRTP